jgi:hypothetical protein
MQSGAGGCFSWFTRPALTFLSGATTEGEQDDLAIEGVVPDSVTSIRLVLRDGARLDLPVSENAFQAKLPSGSEIEYVSARLPRGWVVLSPA